MQSRTSNLQDNPELLRGVLDVVSREPTVTQRRLSRELGVALGVANAVLRRCVTKGLIKIQQAPIRRYGYYLTPLGFTEKSRLTIEYLNLSFHLFRRAREQFSVIFAELAQAGRRRVLLAGEGELAEIAELSARGGTVEIVGVVAAVQAEAFDAYAGRFDAVIITDMREPVRAYNVARAKFAAAGEIAVVAPPLLRITADAPAREAGE